MADRLASTAVARRLRRDQTDAERRLWWLSRDRRLGGLKFRRQVPIGRFVVDFVAFEARLIVEADGGGHAESETDPAREAWLEAQGFRVLRFWNHEVLATPDAVLDRIVLTLPGSRG